MDRDWTCTFSVVAQAAQRNQVTRVIGECVHMHCCSLVDRQIYFGNHCFLTVKAEPSLTARKCLNLNVQW